MNIAKKTLESTVLVVAEDAEGEIIGIGSGFFVREGLIATNQHVIDEAAIIGVRMVNQEHFHPIDSVAAQDAEQDLALLIVSSLNAPALPLGDSDALQIGEPIYAVGNPIGFLEGTFSDGLVSGIRGALPDSKLIQMTAPISEGSSGGPVLNAKGEVVGVSTAEIALGQNLNFAVPSNALKKLIGYVGRPNLVVPTPRPLPPSLPERFEDYTQWGLPQGAKARLGKGSIIELTYSPDGKTIAVAGSIGIWIYDAQTGRELSLIRTTSNVFSVAYSPDGRTIASGSIDNTIRIWNAQIGGTLRTLPGHTNSVFSAAYSPDGRTIASGSVDNTIRIWNAQTGDTLRTLIGHTDWVRSVAYSPDGRTLASGSDDNTIRIWNAQTGDTLRTLPAHIDRVYSAAYSPDGRTIASGSADGTIRIWNAQTGAHLRMLTGHTDSVLSAAYSPDGWTIASGSADSTIRIWNAQTGALLRTREGHTSYVFSVAYSPDGRTIASGSDDGTILLWDVSNQ